MGRILDEASGPLFSDRFSLMSLHILIPDSHDTIPPSLSVYQIKAFGVFSRRCRRCGMMGLMPVGVVF